MFAGYVIGQGCSLLSAIRQATIQYYPSLPLPLSELFAMDVKYFSSYVKLSRPGNGVDYVEGQSLSLIHI